MPSTKELAVALVSSFGDPDAIAALVAGDVEWWISPAVEVFPHHMVGREMVAETMRFVFGEVYAEPRVTSHHAIVEDDVAAVRITLRARSAPWTTRTSTRCGCESAMTGSSGSGSTWTCSTPRTS